MSRPLAHLLCSSLLFLAGTHAKAATFAWVNPPVSGAFNAPSSWQNADGGGGYPGAGDFAIFRDGTYTVTCDGASAGTTEMIGTVTFQLDGDYAAGSYIQGGHSVVLQGGGTLRTGPFSSLSDGLILIDGSGLTMDRFDFGTSGIQTRIKAVNGARITSSAQLNGYSLPQPRLESGSEWHHTGALNVGKCFLTGGSLLAGDELTVLAELDGSRLHAGLLKGSGHAINGSTVDADTASLSDWLLDGGGNTMRVSGTTVPGLLYADISIKSGATFSAGALADNAWYTVDGNGSSLAVGGRITGDGPQKVTVQNQGHGSAASLSKTSVIVRDAGSVFSYANKAEDSTLQIKNGGRITGGEFVGPSATTTSAGCLVSGAGSALVLSGNLDLGTLGEASLTVEDGGTLDCAKAYLDGGKVGGNSDGSVFGANSFWLARDGMAVGNSIGAATLNLGDGGRVEVRGTAMAVGLLPGSEGKVDVNGGSLPSPSALDTRLARETGVGTGGKGLLSVRSRGRILASKCTVGVNAGSDGTLEIIGAGTSLEVGDTLEIGRAGASQMTIFAGGLATAPTVLVGSNTGTNVLHLTGAGSTLTVASVLHVGEAGAGRLSIEQGSRVELPGALANDRGLARVAFQPGSVGQATVNGVGSAWIGERGELIVGAQGAGTLSVTNGGLVNFEQITIGSGAPGATGVATISGSGSVMRTLNLVSIGGITSQAPTGPGEINVTSGGLLQAGFNLEVFKPGLLRLNGGAATVGQVSEAAIPGTVLIGNQGKFRLGGKLIGSLLLRQGGTFLPGSSPGKATIEGDLTLATGTSLEIEVGGPIAGVSYDQIEATGTVTLAGHLTIVFRDGFAPTNGQIFEVVKGGLVLGNFSDVTVQGLADGFTYSLAGAGGTSLTLNATSTGIPIRQPTLNIVRSTGGNLVVSWPDNVANWTLQQANELPTENWQPLAAPGNTITVPATAGTMFFRLISR